MSFTQARKFLETLTDPQTKLADTLSNRCYVSVTLDRCIETAHCTSITPDMRDVLVDRIDAARRRFPWLG